jgi:5'-nucleotidase (lipoprotein e(P4) family)
MRHTAAALLILATLWGTARAETPPPAPPPKPPAAEEALQIKWMRDSAEYVAITRGTYADAAEDVLAAAKGLKKSAAWGVILDVDETALDNSTYQLERLAYGVGFDDSSWNAWCARRAAAPIPGTREFVTAVRAAGGRVAYVTNRSESTREDTRANLEAAGLWAKDDALCLLADGATSSSKAERRQMVQKGDAACGWAGTPVTVLAFVGDQITDFPGKDEGLEPAWGKGWYMLPNPMYGGWTRSVTR